MDVFISWSGETSQAVAELLQEWIKCVLQPAKPWVSSQNLERGGIWFSDISEKLKDSSVGIICLTQDNKERPWIMFEAGAMAKGLQANRVCPFLIDLNPEDVKDPLAQFNATTSDRVGLEKLVKTLNAALGEKGLESSVLKNVFDRNYPFFEEPFSRIKASIKEGDSTQVTPEDTLSQILASIRTVANRVARIEDITQSHSVDLPASIRSKRGRVRADMMSGTELRMAINQMEKDLKEAHLMRELYNEKLAEEAQGEP